MACFMHFSESTGIWEKTGFDEELDIMTNRYFVIFAVISLLTFFYGLDVISQSRDNQRLVEQDYQVSAQKDQAVARTDLE